jgi:hypothetical protein
MIGAGTAGLSARREVRTQRFVIVNDGPWCTVCARGLHGVQGPTSCRLGP